MWRGREGGREGEREGGRGKWGGGNGVRGMGWGREESEEVRVCSGGRGVKGRYSKNDRETNEMMEQFNPYFSSTSPQLNLTIVFLGNLFS